MGFKPETLAKLHQIDWKSRKAEDVPFRIEELASPDAKVRKNAQRILEEKILYADEDWQNIDLGYGISSVLKTDVHTLIVPFLIDLLNLEEDNDKSDLLWMLWFMAGYENFHYEEDIYVERARQISQAIWKGRDTYITLLTHKDASVRLASVELLVMDVERRGDNLSLILQTIQAEEEQVTKAQMLWEINEQIARNLRWSESDITIIKGLLLHYLTTENTHALKITSAVMLIDLLKSEAPPEAIDYLVETLINPIDPDHLSGQVSALSINIQGSRLLKLGVEKGIQAANRVIRYTQNPDTGSQAVFAALVLAFNPSEAENYHTFLSPVMIHSLFRRQNPPTIDIENLNAAQQMALQALTGAAWSWSIFDIFPPKQRAEILKFLR